LKPASDAAGYIRLHWTSTDRRSGEKRQCENRIALTRARGVKRAGRIA
jgi:hypothetical protein